MGGGPASLSIEDLTSIYQIVYAAEAGTDPFENPKIQHLRKPLQEYLSRQPDRHKALSMQPRIVSEPADACADFDLLIVPADTTNPNVEEIRKSWETRILPCQVSHFHVLALECRDLPSEDGFDEAKRRRLLKLVEYEIRYLRGCDIRWVGGSLPGKGAESGPDNN